jgi:hypothetical protein
VYDKIFRLSELKSMVKQLKELDCTEGKQRQGYRSMSTEPINKVAEIKIPEKDEMIKKWEEEIESIQEELDAHNAKTKI